MSTPRSTCAQLVEQVGAPGVVEDQHGHDLDAALLAAAPAAHAGHLATVADGGEDQLALHGAVGQRVDALGVQLAHAGRDVVAAPHDLVGAQVAHQLLVLLAGVRDDPQPVGLGQLHEVAAEGTGCAGDGEGRAGGERPAPPARGGQ